MLHRVSLLGAVRLKHAQFQQVRAVLLPVQRVNARKRKLVFWLSKMFFYATYTLSIVIDQRACSLIVWAYFSSNVLLKKKVSIKIKVSLSFYMAAYFVGGLCSIRVVLTPCVVISRRNGVIPLRERKTRVWSEVFHFFTSRRFIFVTALSLQSD